MYGSAAALYPGGDFTGAAGVLVTRIARWDGSGWSALTGADNTVEVLGVYDGSREPGAGSRAAGARCRAAGARSRGG